ncbi:MAG TPA: hypothetical protein VF530_07455 [Planctomycetota bacterium]
MLPLFLLASTLALATPMRPQEAAAKPDAAAAELFRARCLGCHVPPDPRFEVERTWIAQVAQTRCGDTPAELRQALVAYLEARPLPLPEVIDTQRPAEKGEATLMANFRRGAVLFEAPDGRLVRVSWDELGGERRRPIPPGRYRIVGIRLSTEVEGVSWHMVGSGFGNTTLDFRAGATHVVALDAVLRLEERIGADRYEVALVGHEDAGISLYRGGERLPLRWRRLDAAGEPLDEGLLEFGREGRAAARFEPVEGARAAEIVLEKLPFTVRRVRM